MCVQLPGDAMRAVVVGGGVFGLGTAISLRERGWDVTVVEAGTVPDPRAASTDISKLIRMDYGDDAHYHDMMRAALPRWRAWNVAAPGLFHEDGVLFLSSGTFADNSFEAKSRRLLARDGVRHAAVSPSDFGWRVGSEAEAYVDEEAGWAPSGQVVAWLADRARAMGAVIKEHAAWKGLIRAAGRTVGVEAGERILGDAVIVAAGTWSWRIVPELAGFLRTTAQPVVHFAVDADRFCPPRFLPWAFDIARTGWYGFPALPDGRLKIAHHGAGWSRDPDVSRLAPEDVEAPFRQFLRDHLPQIADASIVARRLCLYSDTPDGDFLIDRHPTDEGLYLATGGSGHAFKFAPVLGDCVADVVEARPNPWTSRFAWRAPHRGLEAARAERGL
jgi:glycine/D-amino acid oxidase-like deaminating enzyme